MEASIRLIESRFELLHKLEEEERTKGKASFELLNLEDELGHYADTLEALIALYRKSHPRT